MTINYQKTIYACFVGYITQAIVNNFAPLLFLTFTKTYDISLSGITLITTLNFAVQLITDLLAIWFVDRLGYKKSALLAHVLCALGLMCMAILPEISGRPLAGLLTAVVIYAVGGGLLEVLISPIVEACPTQNKEKAMSMLHSFYCWGQVGVILASTLFFYFAGIRNWKVLAFIWALVPIINTVFFMIVPMPEVLAEENTKRSLFDTLKNKMFWFFAIIMVCAGAAEHGIAQWASSLAESALGLSKTLGDIAGPMFFGVTMGISRVFYGKKGEKIKLTRFISISAALCVISYFIIGLSPGAMGLIGFGLCGLSVGIFWPGTLSMASAGIKGGGTSMFALLALAGDLGCSLGPTVVGTASDFFGENLKAGVLTAAIFPVILLVTLMIQSKRKKAQP